jgi:hypothetical protein
MFWDLGSVTLDSFKTAIRVAESKAPNATHRPGLPVLPTSPLRTAENTELGSEANKVQREEQRKDEEIGEKSVTSTISSRPTKRMGATTSRISPKRWRAKLLKRS